MSTAAFKYHIRVTGLYYNVLRTNSYNWLRDEADYHVSVRDYLRTGNVSRARIFKLSWSTGIDSEEPIPPAYVARAGIFKCMWGVGTKEE
jgi:hypothetical protein